ncbi:LAFE_0G02498g1_1 [Lachancea fermentati]|uniref:LAFE_0G02498g1_1 n=1 Tax=Lachancea fermentati TaxID=4955 RepID=A0A1G4MGR8_LACFM|nr:LAFE_0G02498g1_1 [Lachancea fermentati]
MDLTALLTDEVDIYSLLGLSATKADDMSRVSVSQVRTAYRKQALRYHPDKNQGDPEAIHKFHLLSVATKVLSDAKLRKTYDSWFIDRFLSKKEKDEQRQHLINKLHTDERKAATKKVYKSKEIYSIEKYGELLRKLKHFNKSYGDWKDLKIEEKMPKHRLYESSAVRIVVENHKILQEKSASMDLLGVALGYKVYDLFYSSRNDNYNDLDIVIYVVFENPSYALDVLERWANKSYQSSDDVILSYIKDISPRAPPDIFKFPKRVELDAHIKEALLNEVEVSD